MSREAINIKRISGFTLIELMIVVAIIGIISAIAIPTYSGYMTTARQGECINEMAAIRLAELDFFRTNLTYFSGNGVAAIQVASGNRYVPSAAAQGIGKAANCTYVVAATGCSVGGANCTGFTITGTGANQLAGKYNQVITGP